MRIVGQIGKSELGQLARAVTNNETYLFRETGQFDSLFEHALEDLTPFKIDIVTGGKRRLAVGIEVGLRGNIIVRRLGKHRKAQQQWQSRGDHNRPGATVGISSRNTP